VQRKISYFGILLIALAVVTVLMSAFNGIDFLSFRNLKSMAFQMPELGILTLAMMIAMLTSGINLSIIATANLSGIVMALILTQAFPEGSPLAGSIWVTFLAILAGLVVGAIIAVAAVFILTKSSESKPYQGNISDENRSAITGKGIEVKKTIPAGITVHHLGFHHTGPDHGFRRFSIIGLFFFRLLTCQANGLVIKDGQNSLVLGSQFRVASIACHRAGQFVFPLVFHCFTPLY